MRKLLMLFIIFLGISGNTFAKDVKITQKMVKQYVNKGVALIEKKGSSALDIINKKDGEFMEGSLYVFVYNDKVTIVAHPFKNRLVGKNYKGKADIKGKKFRDDIVNNTLKNGEAWTSYVYQKPDTKGLFHKKVYSKLATTKKGKKYIVCAGMYEDK